MSNDAFLLAKLNDRVQANALRKLTLSDGKVDFCSNDYLGIAYNDLLADNTSSKKHGSTGSRLLAGNYALIEQVEDGLAQFHEGEAALIFNSGYDANVGLLSCIAQKGDTILYDQLVHASIRDGIRLSFAQAFSFTHNDVAALEERLRQATGNIFIVTESVFSMDGDQSDIKAIAELCTAYGAHLIVDEAHSLGIIGEKGEGLVQQLSLHKACLARVYTFGKGAGCHGAAVVGSKRLKDYLINFSRSFIYTTALPEIAVQAIRNSYTIFPGLIEERRTLAAHIRQFQEASLRYAKLMSQTSIQVVMVPGNDAVKEVALHLQTHNFDVRAILYPTVPKGGERLRIVLHAFNTTAQVAQLLKLLS